jgi:hypothetical protein
VRDPYVILITIYIFMPWFVRAVVGDPVQGQALVAHPHTDGSQSAQGEPAVVRAHAHAEVGHAAPYGQPLRFIGDDRADQGVGVAGDVLRAGMDRHVDAMVERTEEVGRAPAVEDTALAAEGGVCGVNDRPLDGVLAFQHFRQVHVIADGRTLAALYDLQILHHEAMQSLHVLLPAAIHGVQACGERGADRLSRWCFDSG